MIEYFIDEQHNIDETIYAIFSLNGQQDISEAKLEAIYYTKEKALEDLEYLNHMSRKRSANKIQKTI